MENPGIEVKKSPKSKEKLHSRGASGRKESASNYLDKQGSVFYAGKSTCEIESTNEGSSRKVQSGSHSGHSSRHQALESQVVAKAKGRGSSTAPKSGSIGDRSPSIQDGYNPKTDENQPRKLRDISGIAAQKNNTLPPDHTLETSSDDTSASEIIPENSYTSSASCLPKRMATVSLLLLLTLGVAGVTVYYTMFSRSEESVIIPVGTPTSSPPKEAGNELEIAHTVPLGSETTLGPPPTFPPSLSLQLLSEVPVIQTASQTPAHESLSPVMATSNSPSLFASLSPSTPLAATPAFPKITLGGPQEQVTTFYAIGDVPYTPREAEEIEVQIRNIPSDAEFVIHVGDLRSSDQTNPLCLEEEYILAAEIFKKSHAPVFVILGDNEIECSNPTEGMQFWNKHFLRFDSRHWNHTFDIQRQPGRPYNFAFVHKKTLFIGLNIIGLPVRDAREWEVRLTEEVEWTKELIRYYSGVLGETGRVVIFGHANPSMAHFHYFGPLEQFIDHELNNQIPILYLNGDKHEWSYDPSYLGQESLLRIMVTGGSSEPPLKVRVVANGKLTRTGRAFLHDRRL